MFGSILTLSSARAEVILYKSRGEFFMIKFEIWAGFGLAGKFGVI